MATFHLNVAIHSRGKGHSAIAGAAYRERSAIFDERTGERHDYSRKSDDVLFAGMYSPADAPEWTRDRAQLWNHVEAFEKRRDAQLARVFNIALPHELTLEQNRRLLQDWVRDNFTRKGLIADAVIHAPDKDGDQRNIHAHVAVVLRKLDGTEFSAKKERTASEEERLAQMEGWRASWENLANRHLERAGLDVRIDRRTLKEQGIDAEPTKHVGPTANKMEREEPGSSDRAAANREITQRNAERETIAALEAEERALTAQIIDLKAEREAREAAKGRTDDPTAADQPPEITREFASNANRTTEPAAPIYDRDADNAAWEEKVTDAAIGETGGHAQQQPGVDAGRETTAFAKATADGRAGAGEASNNSPHNQAKPEDTRPLGKTAAEIIMAWTLSRSADQFEEALAAKGISLAVVSREEAEQSQRTAAFAKAVGNFASILKAGEIVAVNDHGNVHRFNQRTTGEAAPDIEARFPGIDRAALMNVADTKEAMQAAALEAWKAERAAEREQARPASWIESRIAACAEQAAGLGATVLEDASGRRVDRVEALADRLRIDGERQTHAVTVHGRDAFAARLDDAGIAIVRVTETDAKAIDALRAGENVARLAAETNNEAYQGRHFAVLLPGDLAAVTRNGDVHRINPDKFSDAKQFLDPANLPGVVETRARFEIEGERQAEVWAQHSTDIADWQLQRDNDRAAARFDAVEITGGVKAAEREVEAAPVETADATRESVSLLTRLGQLFMGLFGGWAMAPPKLTPAQAKQEARAEAEERPQRDIARERAEWEARLATLLDADARSRRRQRETGQDYDRDDDRGRERER